MKNSVTPKLHILLSQEHKKYQSDIVSAFKGLDVSVDSRLIRLSAGELPIQLIISLGAWIGSNIAWDLLKLGIKNVYKKFDNVRIDVRDDKSIMYAVWPNLSVKTIVTADRAKEFEHIKTIDDVISSLGFLKNKPSQKDISEEWTQKTLGDVLEKMEGGGTPSKDHADFWDGLIPWASVKDIVTHNPNDTQDHISEAGLKNSSSRIVPKGTLIVPTRMALGHAVFFNVDVSINQDLKALYPKENLKNEYLYYWFQSKRRFIERLGSGSTVSGIQQNELKSIKFNLPSLPEQNRIVAVLETWDQAIQKLSQKIEKKKNIKKGLMQELLTGKKRLNGFKSKWSEKKLADFSELIHGDGNWILSENITENGRYKIVQLGSIGLGRYLYKKLKTISEIDFFKVKGTLLMKGDLLINRMVDGNLNLCLFMETGEYVTSVDVCWIRENNFLDNYFLMQFMLLDSNQSKLLSLSSGSGRVRISKKNLFEKFKFHIPKIDEQKAISKILITADQEIQTLERKLKILQEQKRYLLNNLITGTIRTPETLSTKITE